MRLKVFFSEFTFNNETRQILTEGTKPQQEIESTQPQQIMFLRNHSLFLEKQSYNLPGNHMPKGNYCLVFQLRAESWYIDYFSFVYFWESYGTRNSARLQLSEIHSKLTNMFLTVLVLLLFNARCYGNSEQPCSLKDHLLKEIERNLVELKSIPVHTPEYRGKIS